VDWYGEDCSCEEEYPLGHGFLELSSIANVSLNYVVDEWTHEVERGAQDILAEGEDRLWQSVGVCRTEFAVRQFGEASLNVLLNACRDGFCTTSCDCDQSKASSPGTYTAYTCSSQEKTHRSEYPVQIYPIDTATDGDSNNGNFVRGSTAAGETWFEVRVPNPQPLSHVYLKASVPNNTVLSYVDMSGQEGIVARLINGGADMGALYTLPEEAAASSVASLRLVYTHDASAQTVSRPNMFCGGNCFSMQVQEIVARPRGSVCADEITFDLGDVFDVAIIHAKVYSSNVQRLFFSLSMDNEHYVEEEDVAFDPSFWLIDHVQDFQPNLRAARYVRVTAVNDFKISVIDIDIYGASASPDACFNACSGHGQCVSAGEEEGGSLRCDCEVGFFGDDCSGVACGVANCSNRGTCVAGTCLCDPGNWGADCSQWGSCAAGCWGNGECVEGRCRCEDGFEGVDCRFGSFRNHTRPTLDLRAYPFVPPNDPAFVDDTEKCGGVSIGACSADDLRDNPNPFVAQWNPAWSAPHSHWATSSSFASTLPSLPLTAATASSLDVEHPMENAVDGSDDTFWKSAGPDCTIAEGGDDTGCVEYIVVDLGVVQEIGALRCLSFFSGVDNLVAESTWEYSDTVGDGAFDDGEWTVLLPPYRGGKGSPYYGLEVEFPAPLPRFRYLRFSQRKVANTSAYIDQVLVKDISLWGPAGPFGDFPPATPSDPAQKKSIHELFGVNSIWGMFMDRYSDTHSPGNGPHRFSEVASHGRSYHNLHWDTTDPKITPDFAGMGCSRGTHGQWWLDWNREYGAWNRAGLDVQTSIQFYEGVVPSESWGHAPYNAAYDYGYAFATAFGPTRGTGTVDVVEVGNEPDYAAELYSEILLGMAMGIKDADAAVKVLPGIIVGKDMVAEGYMNASHFPYLDGLNTHVYSFSSNDGGRVSLPPESTVSAMRRELLNIITFRDAFLPTLPVYVSEFGWDSDGGGEDCLFPECVSERAQALYAVRSILLFARLGVERSTWFFASNVEPAQSRDPAEASLFNRCGLTGSADAGFEHKQSLRAVEQLVRLLGDTVFMDVVREDAELYAYTFGNRGGAWTHLVTWIPVEALDPDPGDPSGGLKKNVVVALNSLPPFVCVDAWYLEGTTNATGAPADDGNSPVQVNETHFVVAASAVPLVCSVRVLESGEASEPEPEACPGANAACSGQGVCHDGVCLCHVGYTGDDCSVRECDHQCWNHGTCDGSSGTCDCDNWLYASAGYHDTRITADETDADIFAHPAWTFWDPATSCQYQTCRLDCFNQGYCANGLCKCDPSHAGEFCHLKACPFAVGFDEVFECRSHGTCADGKCSCLEGTTGIGCEWDRPAAVSPLCTSSAPYYCHASEKCTSSIGLCVQNYLGGGNASLVAVNGANEKERLLPLTVIAASSNLAAAQLKLTDGVSYTSWISAVDSTFEYDGVRAEYIVADLGEVRAIGAIGTERYQWDPTVNRDTDAVLLQVSDDSTCDAAAGSDDACWRTLHTDRPANLHSSVADISPPVLAQFVRIMIIFNSEPPAPPQAQALLWELQVFPGPGPYGDLPQFQPLPSPAMSSDGRGQGRVSMQDMLGVNSIWGFFTGSYSDWSPVWGVNERASVYGGTSETGTSNEGMGLFRHGRNYHVW
jgi:hypothetical protein